MREGPCREGSVGELQQAKENLVGDNHACHQLLQGSEEIQLIHRHTIDRIAPGALAIDGDFIGLRIDLHHRQRGVAHHMLLTEHAGAAHRHYLSRRRHTAGPDLAHTLAST